MFINIGIACWMARFAGGGGGGGGGVKSDKPEKDETMAAIFDVLADCIRHKTVPMGVRPPQFCFKHNINVIC